MIRFISITEHIGINIVYRKGKANVLVDTLSRPTELTLSTSDRNNFWKTVLNGKEDNTSYDSELNSISKLPNNTNTLNRVDLLTRLDLQSIYEYLHLGEPLPARLSKALVNNFFAVHLGKFHFSKTNEETSIGEPPGPSGANIMLRILEYEEILSKATKIYIQLGHASIGLTRRQLLEKYWHPETMLVVSEVVRLRPSRQLMKRPDPSLPNLMPIIPPQPLTRWAIDHTGPDGPGGHILLNAVEYAIG
ncbi:hypothetical protein K3495_g10663 [Podosphaera aphanis]|nr:hypothetical protein K3495_g10663 [Podosphaera aphanis]